MSEENKKDWKIINVRNGYVVTERCVETGERQSFFSLEDSPPIDNYVHGEHTWKYLGSAQAVQFDLECQISKEVMKLDNILGLMLVLDAEFDYLEDELDSALKGSDSWIYAALSSDSYNDKKTSIRTEQTDALTEYFNSKIKSPGKEVLIIPSYYIKNLDQCQGEIIADVGMTDIY